jgi:anti-sigma factor ChrR (cupin superfamily)
MMESVHDLESLAALAEGRLDATERERVLAHLVQCAECRRTVAELGRTMADGTLAESGRRAPTAMKSARVWLPVAASVLVGTFAWFQLTTNTSRRVEPSPSAAETATNEDELLIRRSAGRKVGDKTFRMSGGVWIDSAFDSSLNWPTVTVRGADERSALLARFPELAPYTELGSQVVVSWQGTVYRFEP